MLILFRKYTQIRPNHSRTNLKLVPQGSLPMRILKKLTRTKSRLEKKPQGSLNRWSWNIAKWKNQNNIEKIGKNKKIVVKMAPKPRKAFSYPLVKAPKARSELKRRGKNMIKGEFCANIWEQWSDRKLAIVKPLKIRPDDPADDDSEWWLLWSCMEW